MNNDFDAPQGFQPLLGRGAAQRSGASMSVIGADHSNAEQNQISLLIPLAVVDVSRDGPETRKISYGYYSFVPLE
ncbi:hypothetical protein ACQKLN_11310 [Paenibacillus glucanolyticus]|uniref:hypothetical protein n=1 Tax=Paenibacillus glucanolyticus TaxID=59843 RepID=UPI0036981664